MLTETNQDGNIYIVVDNATKEKVQKMLKKVVDKEYNA